MVARSTCRSSQGTGSQMVESARCSFPTCVDLPSGQTPECVSYRVTPCLLNRHSVQGRAAKDLQQDAYSEAMKGALKEHPVSVISRQLLAQD